jgi:3-oxoacyl-[acyl-carrier protein] reductase
MGTLEGKVALVTGSARNIGRAIAMGLAAEGAHVVVNARSSRADVEAVASDIRSAGGSASVIMADLSEASQVKVLFAQIKDDHRELDILVNNAAVRRETPLSNISAAEWRIVMSSILDASFFCSQAAASMMPDGGRIISLGGLSAHTGALNRAHVVAAKAGLVGLTKALAMELAPRHITVNLVAPGRIDTNREKTGAPHPTHHSGHNSPLGVQGSPEDVAAMIVHLAGPGGQYITGQTIHVNGGIYLP